MDKHDIRVTVKGREEGGWLDEADRNPHAYEIVLRICSVTWPRLPMIDRRFIDVSHTVEDGLITYKGLPAPVICDYLSREASRAHYAPGTEFHIGKIERVANTGTYLDAPFHRYADGKDLAALPLSGSWAEWACASPGGR